MFYEMHHIVPCDPFKKEYGENFCYPPHLHLYYELIVLLSGEMEVTVGRTNYYLKDGDAILVFPNQVHSLTSELHSKHLLFIFSPELIHAFNSQKRHLLPVCNKFQLNDSLVAVLDQLDNTSSLFAIKSAFYSVCDIFERTTQYFKVHSSENNLLLRIFAFVDANYTKDCSLQRMSAEVGCAYAYASRYFRKMVGISYNSYVNYYRLNAAVQLLRDPDLTVLECAIESGHNSLRTFNRNFKEYFNMSPGQFRANTYNIL